MRRAGCPCSLLDLPRYPLDLSDLALVIPFAASSAQHATWSLVVCEVSRKTVDKPLEQVLHEPPGPEIDQSLEINAFILLSVM